ncbi:hypothetical protein ACLKA6_014234 [Drosophila palustris]
MDTAGGLRNSSLLARASYTPSPSKSNTFNGQISAPCPHDTLWGQLNQDSIRLKRETPMQSRVDSQSLGSLGWAQHSRHDHDGIAGNATTITTTGPTRGPNMALVAALVLALTRTRRRRPGDRSDRNFLISRQLRFCVTREARELQTLLLCLSMEHKVLLHLVAN